MKRIVPGVALLALFVFSGGAVAPGRSEHVLTPATAGAPLPEMPAGAATAEIARVRAHLAAVERELLARDVSALPTAQRAARAHQIEVLREYRERGAFPHNHVHPEGRTPVFVDEHGTHCAVGYLLARSGRQDLVARIAATRNLARVPEMADEPELLAWLDEAGLSAAEAAHIQPSYGPIPEPDERVSTEYAIASALSLGFGGAAIALNLPTTREPDGWRGLYGLASGAYGIGLGASKWDERGTPQLLGVLNAAVGTAAAVLGARTLWAGLLGRDDTGDFAARSGSGRDVSVTAMPVVLHAREGGEGRVGLQVGVRF